MMPAPYQANEIADWFLGNIDRDAGDSITHLKLQKLVYYGQAWSLALRDEPLFDEDMQAWAHGPVAPSVYRRFDGVKWAALDAPAAMPALAEDANELLTSVLASYGDMSAKHLENMTHAERPWLETRGDLAPEARSNRPISKELMASYYKDLYLQAEHEEEQDPR